MIYSARNTQSKKPDNSFKKKRIFKKPQTIRKPIRRQRQTPSPKTPFFTIIIWAKHSTYVKSIIQTIVQQQFQDFQVLVAHKDIINLPTHSKIKYIPLEENSKRIAYQTILSKIHSGYIIWLEPDEKFIHRGILTKIKQHLTSQRVVVYPIQDILQFCVFHQYKQLFMLENDGLIKQFIQHYKLQPVQVPHLIKKLTPGELYPELFHKYGLYLSKPHQPMVYSIINGDNPFDKTIVAHLHCYNIDEFFDIYGEILEILHSYFKIVVTFSIGTKIPKQLTCLLVDNRGMDIGGKFCVVDYLKNKDYTHILFLHSKSNPERRALYFTPFIENLEEIIDERKEYDGVFPDIKWTIDGEISRNKKGEEIHEVNHLYRNQLLDYLKIEDRREEFIEGNVYFLTRKVSEWVFGDLALYNILNQPTDFDYNYMMKKYGVRGEPAELFQQFGQVKISPGENFGNIEQSFERIVLNCCERSRIIEKYELYNIFNEEYDYNLYSHIYSDINKLTKIEKLKHYRLNGIKENRIMKYIDTIFLHTDHLSYNIIGHFKGIFGLAENSRQIYNAINNYTNKIIAISDESSQHDYSYKNSITFSPNALHNINIICKNWNESEKTFYLQNTINNNYIHKINIPLWAFETERILPIVNIYEKYFSKIFTISKYCEQAMIDSGINKHKINVLNIPSIKYNKLVPTKNEAITYFTNIKNHVLSKTNFYVGFIFDFFSSFYRKNIIDALDVFSNSIAEEKNTYFIIKYINHTKHLNHYNILLDYINTSKYKNKIILVEEIYSSVEINYFYSLFDLYLSLHRCEGSGLTLMTTIYRNIPTVCTNYSGNLDFCNKYNSFLVDYHLTEINSNCEYRHFKNICKWAQPDLNQAIKYVKEIYINYNIHKKSISKYNYYIKSKFNTFNLGKQIIGYTIPLLTKLKYNHKILIIIHAGNYNILIEFLDKITVFNYLTYDIYIGFNSKTTHDKFMNNKYFTKLNPKLILYENIGKDTIGRLHILKSIPNINNYKLCINLQTKSNKMWRKALTNSLLIEKNIINIIEYLKHFPNTGIFSGKNTISPLINNMSTVKKICKLINISTNYYNIYNDEHNMFYKQTIDIDTYLENYIDIKLTFKCNDIVSIKNHILNNGILEKRIYDKDLTDILTYNNKYPLISYGGNFICTPKILLYIQPFIDDIIELSKNEIGDIKDTNKPTITHAMERIYSIISHHLKMDLCEIDDYNIYIKRNYKE